MRSWASLLLSVWTGSPGGADWQYALAADPALNRLEVELCFAGAPPARLVPAEEEHRPYLIAAEQVRDGRPERLVESEGALSLVDRRPGACVRYTIDLARAAREAGSVEIAARVGQDVVFTPDLWLWGPPEARQKDQVGFIAALPPGVHASVPWTRPLRGRRGEALLRVEDSTYRWRSLMSLSSRPPLALEAAGARFVVQQLGGPLAATPAELSRWIEGAAQAVRLSAGAFPVERVLVLLVAVPSAEVEFGMVQRGGGPTALIYVGDRARGGALPGEWVLVHELSHLVLPFVRAGDAWLSEGLATYLQDVLRARAGLQTEEAMWSDLVAGFARGRANETGRTLEESSARLSLDRDYMRVYWGGAALALLADVELRERSGGKVGLDEALARLRADFNELRRPSGEELLARLDRLVGQEVFARLHQRVVRARGFPELEPTLARLGVQAQGDAVRLDPRAPWAHHRRGIMGRRR